MEWLPKVDVLTQVSGLVTSTSEVGDGDDQEDKHDVIAAGDQARLGARDLKPSL